MKSGTAHYWLAGALCGMALLWLALFGPEVFGPQTTPPAPPSTPEVSIPLPPPLPEHVPPAPVPLPTGAGLLIVMDDMGESLQAVHELLQLEIPVVLSIWPHSRFARQSAEAAHKAGRDVFIHLPMEPRGYPRVQPGPGAVMVGSSREAIREIVRQALSRVPHAVGINNHMGSRATADAACVQRLCDVLAPSGLVILDSVTDPGSVLYTTARSRGLPVLRRRIFLDNSADRRSVLAQLDKAQQLAAQGGVVAIGHPHAETLAALRQWAASRRAGAPVVTVRQLFGVAH